MVCIYIHTVCVDVAMIRKKSNSCHHFTLHFQTLTALPSWASKRGCNLSRKKGPAANQNCKMGMYYSGKTPIFKTTLTAARTQALGRHSYSSKARAS